ncbi:MAG: DNA translocase FtsK, partial [Candidatus Kapaibacterium sp.]
ANDEELAIKGRLLRDKLATFGVDIENITVTPGPVVTLYEFTPAEGVKVSRVENLTDDIALAMKARGIRIIAPIPGRGTIGVEIPNDVAKIVRIRELFESQSFRNTKMNLPLALGKTISGDVYVDDLNKMPHLLIAGATGSGKSVGVNGIIASLLYAKSPRDVKFVIVDPKKIELSLYKKLRKHYLIVSPEAGEDIVTTPMFAVVALKAVEIEMERRYDKLAKAAVRSLADYNIKVAQGKLRSTQEEQHYHLPYIVVIIDELADLMITAAREIEEPICRIAQMARAVGIHMILATQRPSVDVITGVIKANFPARVAFQVATRVDSRTILDSMGAEQLMGNGDMLYQPSGTPKPIRLQSPFISTEEVEAIVDAIAVQDGDKLSYSRPWTLPSLRERESGGAEEIEEGDDRDELFEEAAKTVVRHQQGSVSLLQRRLKIGYSRAARVMDELEMAAIVGAFDGSKARQVLCETEAELEVVLEGLR